jgi:hypothetical protein
MKDLEKQGVRPISHERGGMVLKRLVLCKMDLEIIVPYYGWLVVCKTGTIMLN